MSDAVLVDALGVVIQVNRDAAAKDLPATQLGTWENVSSGLVFAGMIRDGADFKAPALPPAAQPAPSAVTNYQARAVMRMTPMPDGRSLLETVRSALKADLDRVQGLPEMDPDRVTAEVAWEAWEQANVYERNGPLVSSLASRFGFDDAMTDDLFRQAERVTA